MRELDPTQPIFSQRDVAACTILDKGGLDNYIQHGHAHPTMIGGRRTFTALQMIHIQVIAQLAAIFGIPPSVGSKLAERLMRKYLSESGGALPSDARDAGSGPAWINAATIDGHAAIERLPDGTARDLDDPSPDGVTLSFPIQHMAREVLSKAHAILNGAA